MITLLTGRNARALSLDICRRVGAHIRKGEKAFLLVPEQQTLLAENMLIDCNALPGLFDAEVLSLRRLSQRVLAQAGGARRDVLDSTGRTLLLGRILLERRDELAVYRAAARHPGFLQRLSEQVAELRRLSIPPESVAALSGGTGGKLARKLSDIALLYAAYQDAVQDKYLDEADLLRAFLDGLADYAPLRNAHVYADGFESITPQLSDLFLALHPLAGSLMVTQLLDESGRDAALFTHVRESARRFSRRAQEAQITVRREVSPGEDMRPEELRALSRELFALPKQPYTGQIQAVEWIEAQNPVDEAEQIAALIEENLRGGRRPGDIAVLCGDMEALGRQLERICRRRGLPVWLDRREEIARHPAMRYLLGALHCARDGYTRSHIMEILRSGYTALSRDEADQFENYCIEKGIKGNMFISPLRRGGEEMAARMEALRVQFIGPVQAFCEKMRKSRSVRLSVLAIEELLEETGISTLLTRETGTLDAEALRRHSLDVQVWNSLCTVLGRMLALLEDTSCPVEEFAALLEPSLAALTVGQIPPRKNSITISSPGHLKEDKPVVFFCGLHDALFSAGEEGLLQDDERSLLASLSGEYFGMGKKQRSDRKRLDIYIALGRAGQRLCLSRSRTSMAGTNAAASPLLEYIQKALTSLEKQDIARHAPLRLCSGEEAGFALLMHSLRDKNRRPLARALERHYAALPEYGRRLRGILGAANTARQPQLRADLPAAIYDLSRTSVSRLETFAECPYRHFVQYGLRPAQLLPWDEIQPFQRGNYFHATLEAYTRDALRDEIDFTALTRAESAARVRKASASIIEALGETIFDENALMRAYLEDMEGAAGRTAWLISRQWARSRFRPYAEEWRFGEGSIPPLSLDLPDGRTIRLRGSIDRLDLLVQPHALVVIDYKSGKNRLAIEDIHEGISLQLPLYLTSAMEILYPGGSVLPGGMLYMAVDPPPVSVEGYDAGQTAQKWELDTRPGGLLLRDDDIVDNLSEDPAYIGVSHNKDGSLGKRDFLLEEKDMRHVLTHAKKRAASLLSALDEGEIDANPLRFDANRTVCSYCDFAAVCGFDGRYERHRDREWDGKEALDRLREEEDNA